MANDKSVKKKVPKGSKKFSWIHIPADKYYPAHYIKITANGVWKTDELPEGVVIENNI